MLLRNISSMHDYAIFSKQNTIQIDQISCKIPKTAQTKSFHIELSKTHADAQIESSWFILTYRVRRRAEFWSDKKNNANACIHYWETNRSINHGKKMDHLSRVMKNSRCIDHDGEFKARNLQKINARIDQVLVVYDFQLRRNCRIETVCCVCGWKWA